MKKLLSILLTIVMAVCLVNLNSNLTKAEVPEFYAVYDTTGEANVLTFYYDALIDTRTGTKYTSLPTQATQATDWEYNNIRSSVKNVKIDSSVENYSGLESTAYMFYQMLFASNISGCEYLDTSNVTNMNNMFYYFGGYATGIAAVPNVSSWDTSKVTNMSYMFGSYACNSNNSNISTVPDVSNWNTGNVTDMSFMFSSYAASSTSFSAVPNVSNWNTSKATSINSMFASYAASSTSISTVPNVSDWNTGSVKNMSSMFSSYAKKSQNLTAVPDVSDWNTGSVTDMSCMFERYDYTNTTITDVPDVSDWNTNKVTTMRSMFSEYAYSSTKTLKSLDISGWSINSLTNASKMFNYYNCSAGVSPVIYGSDWSTTKTSGVSATDMFKDSKLKGTTTGNWSSANTSANGCFSLKQTLSFKNSTITKTYGDAKFTQAVTGAKTTVTYESDDTSVAEVNSSTGEVTIKGAGEATITATAAAGDVEGKSYGSATATYDLTVNKAKVDVPKAKTGLVYTGSEQIGVEAPANAKYTFDPSYPNKQTVANNYFTLAILNDKTNYEWNLTTPTSADQYIGWTINPNVDASKSNVNVNGNKLSTSANKGKFSDLVIDINGTYSAFVTASLKDKDGNVIPDVITLSAGSIKVTISSDYINTLNPGTHNFNLIVNIAGSVYDYSLTVKVNGDTTSSVTKDESCEKVIGPTWHWNNTKGVCEEYALVRTNTK